MKKLENFECEKVEIKNVYGGKMRDCQTYTQRSGQELNTYDGEDPC
ncbi:hypothetical protein OIU83_20465 [Flavobacterium sp. LS1R49]|uniref:Uncharacterized protein n=1 Tax=Flavobacterium shii TaxID=2987687 RepID=A0A9X2ZES8_9FLAO|nr:hypothetical protein [Flavobacterium shii]MCV9930046.1 hypothetical protein [Flavobacterium shii]